jgi:hypothetical protein
MVELLFEERISGTAYKIFDRWMWDIIWRRKLGGSRNIVILDNTHADGFGSLSKLCVEYDTAITIHA